jgi:UPF0755 protein
MKKLKILLFLIILTSIGFYLFYSEGSLPVNKIDKNIKKFIVKSGEPLNNIVNNLNNEGLIRNRIIFRLVIAKLGIEKKIQAGEFQLSPSMSAFEVANNLTHGTADTSLTLIEGMRKEEMAEIISKTFEIPSIEVTEKTREGYIFPDTYMIPKSATFDTVYSIVKNNKKFIKVLSSFKNKSKLTEKEVMILASLVEREARLPATREKIAGIILKRYLADWPLQIDATVQYILGYQPLEKSWWKKELTEEDLKIPSLYNTYLHPGLPPEPICSPSLSSIEAVINANPSTPYWYYITDETGVMHYAVTLEEHEANIARYLR